ncbi:MAG: hypothetical protein J6A59_11065 [Lachnospiraceae bacterium]|nr:hypothetical protein [Lachnospiraceae bacterium]
MATKAKELKYEWVYMKDGDNERIVRIGDVTKVDKGKEFYLKDKDNNIHNVHMVLCDKRRSHFRLNPTFKNSNNEHVEINIKDYAESLLHNLTKQLLVDRDIRQIWLPDLNVEDNEFKFKAKSGRLVKVLEVKKEVVHSDLGIRTDIEIIYEDFNSQTNENRVIIEVYVTSPIDRDKLNKLWNSRLNTLELDLSDLYDDKTLANSELIEEIFNRLTTENENLYWVYNSDKLDILDRLNKQIVAINCDRNSYNIDTEGRWRNYIDSLKLNGVKHCPYKDSAIKMSKGGHYLPESICSKCPRFIKCKITNTNIGPQYRMYCNQVACVEENADTLSRIFDSVIK